MTKQKNHSSWIQELAHELKTSVQKNFVGTTEVIDLSIVGLLGSLHILIEDIPGVGKTTLALSLAKASGLNFSRIQFTPDLLPGDVLGMYIWDSQKKEFIYKTGPIEAQFILADELNRSSPRTQSAFLEAMQEGSFTVEGKTRKLPEPFFMIATQNPETFMGTFPLPEAELDRFGLSFSIGYPSFVDELEIIKRERNINYIQKTKAICNEKDIIKARNEITNTHLDETVRKYIVEIIRSTRENDYIKLGASPRSAVFLQRAAKTIAAIQGRNFVLPEDVERIACEVLAHRIIISSKAKLSKLNARSTITKIVTCIKKPTGL